MTVAVYFNHGKESGPWGSKIRRLAEVVKGRNYAVHSIDYQGITDPQQRVEMLVTSAARQADKLILVGTSMGGYVAAAASAVLKPKGLFLLAPAFYVSDYPQPEPDPIAEKIVILHGWEDDVIPVINSIRYAQKFRAQLHILPNGHRLIGELELVLDLFALFLDQLEI